MKTRPHFYKFSTVLLFFLLPTLIEDVLTGLTRYKKTLARCMYSLLNQAKQHKSANLKNIHYILTLKTHGIGEGGSKPLSTVPSIVFFHFLWVYSHNASQHATVALPSNTPASLTIHTHRRPSTLDTKGENKKKKNSQHLIPRQLEQ